MTPQRVTELLSITEFTWLCTGVDRRRNKQGVRFTVLKIERDTRDLWVYVDVGAGGVFWVLVTRDGEQKTDLNERRKAA